MVPIRPAHHTCVRPYFCRSCAQLDLEDNELGPEGAAALAPAIADSTSVTSVNLSHNALCGVTTNMVGQTSGTYTTDSIIALADALRVSTSSVTSVCAPPELQPTRSS